MKPYTLGIYEKAMPAELSWKEKMETAKAAGYDFIEISIDETEEKLKRLDMGKQERLELVRLMYETGMPIRTMCLSGHRKYPLGSSQPEVSGRGMEIMEKALERQRISESVSFSWQGMMYIMKRAVKRPENGLPRI